MEYRLGKMFILITLSLFKHVNANNPIWLEQQTQSGIYFQVYKALISANWKEMSHLREFDHNVCLSKLIFSLENMIIASTLVSPSPGSELQGNVSCLSIRFI